MLYRLKTSKVFDKSRSKRADGDGSMAPELAKPHLAVKQLAMCPESRMLAVAGASGHVTLFKFRRQEASCETTVLDVSLFFESSDELQGSPSFGPAGANLEFCSRKVKCQLDLIRVRLDGLAASRSSATRSPSARAATVECQDSRRTSSASARGWITKRRAP